MHGVKGLCEKVKLKRLQMCGFTESEIFYWWSKSLKSTSGPRHCWRWTAMQWAMKALFEVIAALCILQFTASTDSLGLFSMHSCSIKSCVLGNVYIISIVFPNRGPQAKFRKPQEVRHQFKHGQVVGRARPSYADNVSDVAIITGQIVFSIWQNIPWQLAHISFSPSFPSLSVSSLLSLSLSFSPFSHLPFLLTLTPSQSFTSSHPLNHSQPHCLMWRWLYEFPGCQHGAHGSHINWLSSRGAKTSQ